MVGLRKLKWVFSFSSELDIFYGVLQGCLLGPLLFNTDICNFFLSTSFPTLQIMLMTPLLANVIDKH